MASTGPHNKQMGWISVCRLFGVCDARRQMGFIALNTDQMVGTVYWIRLNVLQLSRDLMANDREKIELAERKKKWEKERK